MAEVEAAMAAEGVRFDATVAMKSKASEVFSIELTS